MLVWFSKSYRIEMKKLSESKSALNMLKIKLKMKAAKDSGYEQFSNELETALAEQQKFCDALEYDIVVAENMDPGAVSVFVYLQTQLVTGAV